MSHPATEPKRNKNEFRINVYGLGYTGTITAVCLALKNHSVRIYEKNQEMVRRFNEGKPSFAHIELKSIQSQIEQCHKNMAAFSLEEKITAADFHLACVGTPSNKIGDFDLEQIVAVSKNISSSLKIKQPNIPIVLFRSTMLPNSLRELVLPVMEKESGMQEGKDFFLAAFPEFLREGSGIQDTWSPLHFIVGPISKFPEEARSRIDSLFQNSQTLEILTPEECSMIKLGSNAFHSMQIAFANELSELCNNLGISGNRVLCALINENKLRYERNYLKPGPPFGGPCLPKDLVAIQSMATAHSTKIPLLESISISNQNRLNKIADLILKQNKTRIGFHGISFKPETGDTRGSAVLNIIELLHLKNQNLKIEFFDENCSLENLNQKIRTKVIPVSDPIELLRDDTSLLVIGSQRPQPDFLANLIIKENICLDLNYFADISKHLSEKHQNILFLCPPKI